ncbi:MAG: type II toxin-antitoxin system VapC family toxin [Steroidobacteraceae bacterium]
MLADASVWVDHLRRGNATLVARLENDQIWTHPFVIGELACLNIVRRGEFLEALTGLSQLPLVPDEDVLAMVHSRRLMRRGLRWVDVHLLAAAMRAGIPLLTHRLSLAVVAGESGLGWPAAY